MPFEKIVLKRIHCPRCNGIAELRTDIVKPESKMVLVFVVCSLCRYKRYSYTTTYKAIQIGSKIDKLIQKLENLDQNSAAARTLIARINHMKELQRKAELL